MKLTAILPVIAAASALGGLVTVRDAELLVEERLLQNFSVSGSFAIETGSGETCGYCFLLCPLGYTITSADDRLPPVIAYSNTSSLWDLNGASPMLDLATRDLTTRMESLELLPVFYTDNCRMEWGSPPGPLPEQWPPEGTTPTEGWLEENWTQSSPFNAFCPMDLIAGSRSLAGCPAVAMGSILNFLAETNGTRFDDDDDYYHNYHEYYWIDDDCENHDFPSWSELNALMDTLENHYASGSINNQDRAALVYASGAACKQVYTASVSGTFGVGQAHDAYLRFGFDSCELLDESSDSLMERMAGNMMEAMPVHLAIIDEVPQYGHNVVVDGYNTDGFFHINFGWGGSSNGWYSFPLSGMPYGMNIIEGAIVDIGAPLQSAQEEEFSGELSILSISNPVSSFLTAQISAPAGAMVYSITGRLVKTLEAAPGTSISLPTGDLDRGVYVLRVTDGIRADASLFTVLN